MAGDGHRSEHGTCAPNLSAYYAVFRVSLGGTIGGSGSDAPRRSHPATRADSRAKSWQPPRLCARTSPVFIRYRQDRWRLAADTRLCFELRSVFRFARSSSMAKAIVSPAGFKPFVCRARRFTLASAPGRNSRPLNNALSQRARTWGIHHEQDRPLPRTALY